MLKKLHTLHIILLLALTFICDAYVSHATQVYDKIAISILDTYSLKTHIIHIKNFDTYHFYDMSITSYYCEYDKEYDHYIANIKIIKDADVQHIWVSSKLYELSYFDFSGYNIVLIKCF